MQEQGLKVSLPMSGSSGNANTSKRQNKKY